MTGRMNECAELWKTLCTCSKVNNYWYLLTLKILNKSKLLLNLCFLCQDILPPEACI